MKRRGLFHRYLLVAGFLLTVACAQVLAAGKEYVPEPYQDGKDVVWVPTAYVLTNKMLDLARVTAADFVIDLGSGDGRIVIAAAQRGARALGVEYNPDMVALSKRNAIKAGVTEKVRFINADLFETDFSQASVITMFLLPDINLKLRPQILDMKPGTRVVSNSFDMKEWEPDKRISTTKEEGCDNNYCEAYLWIVPARVEGTWRLGKAELALRQTFQQVSGLLFTASGSRQVTEGRLDGPRISFVAGDTLYTGSVDGDTMDLAAETNGKRTTFRAIRVSKTVPMLKIE